MKRIIVMILKNLWRIPSMGWRLIHYANHADQYTEEEKFQLLKEIDHRANAGGNINIVCSGTEGLPKEGGYIIYPNHQGLYDVLAIMEYFPKPFAVVMKKEVEKIPFLKQVFICMGAIGIDRDDVRQGLQVINQVAEEVKQGKIFLIFPEGTRSKNKNQLGEMKAGSFKSATKAKCPIVPVALLDTYQAFDTHSAKKITVQVHYLTPILFEEYKGMKTTEIANLVKSRIQEKIKACENSI